MALKRQCGITEEDSKKRVGLIKERVEKTKTKQNKIEKGIPYKVRRNSTEMAELWGWLDEMKEELLEAIREGFKKNQNNYEEEEEKGGNNKKSELENGENEDEEDGKSEAEE